MEVRPIAADGVDGASETLAQAFRHDPVWGVSLAVEGGSEDHLLSFWRFYVEGARRYDTAFATDGAATVSVWIPPDGTTNPGNNHRYARHGYVPVGQFETVLDQAVVTTMWLPVGG